MTIEQMPRHKHKVFEYSGFVQDDEIVMDIHINFATNAPSSSWTMPTDGRTDGTTKPHENRSPYYALIYIMKIR